MQEVMQVPDMLVKLLELPDDSEDVKKLKAEGINIRRIRAYERSVLQRFIQQNFNESWADEAMAAYSNQPASCFVATHEKKIIGFACYECTCKNYFGPTGVLNEYRGKQIGKVLLMASLRALLEMGYAYCVIGGAGPTEFYTKCCGATLIPDSVPGFYSDGLER
jgi:predicted N-acetyltransferase YhbS